MIFVVKFVFVGGARWPRGQSAQRAIAEAKQRSQRPVIGCVTKIYYLELLRASEGTLSRWSRLHLQSFVSTAVSRRVDVRQAAGRKNNCRIFITWWQHVLPTPLSGISVGKRRRFLIVSYYFVRKNVILRMSVRKNSLTFSAPILLWRTNGLIPSEPWYLKITNFGGNDNLFFTFIKV
jgi:hypothetical protein